MAKLRIVCGPAGSGKTATLGRRWQEYARRSPGAALWLGPTRRAVAGVRAQLIQSSGVLLGAQFWAFADFVDEIVRCNDPAARPLSGVQRRLLTEDVVARLKEAGDLGAMATASETRGFGEGLATLVDELRQYGVSSEKFSEAARGGIGGAKAAACAAFYREYERELERSRRYDRLRRATRAVELLDGDGVRPFGAVRAAFVDGFASFTRQEYDLLDRLMSRLDEIWISLPDEVGDDREELFARPRRTLERLRRFQPTVERLRREAVEAPAGLAHLETQLFRPLRQITTAKLAAGVEMIQAPGVLGEVRLVARRIKTLLLDGVEPADVLVTARELSPYADLIREVFDEYGIPADVEGDEPLARNGAVAALLHALRLPDDDWPFGELTALLRNSYFQPPWLAETGGSEAASRTDVLLRSLQVPRGRDGYLAAAARRAHAPEPGNEDETAEESRRQRVHELAKDCEPFLKRFFQCWDGAPAKAPLGKHVAWVREFAEGVGFMQTARENVRDRQAWRRLWDEIDAWTERDDHRGRSVDRKTFLRRLATLVDEAGVPLTEPDGAAVRVLSAGQARHFTAGTVFLLGLGERGFPQLSTPPSLFDESERQQFAESGWGASATVDQLADEMLLYYEVVTRARQRLILSYPAVDQKGQELLPGSFLESTLACFDPGVVPVERRNMLIEGFQRDLPLSPADLRVRVAAAWSDDPTAAGTLAGDLGANVADAADLFEQRFRRREFTAYDGLIRHAAAVAELNDRFGASKVFSPTALEDYVACPFRFFLKSVLRLEPLEEPSEAIEVTRRGQAIHLALARLHKKLHSEGVRRPTDDVASQVGEYLDEVATDYAARMPSPAGTALWQLEGIRLRKTAGRYRDQWQKFIDDYDKQGRAPEPSLFEVDFGLPGDKATSNQPPPLILRTGDVEVRISGRIDRVDTTMLPGGGVGFWIIDYKTGASGQHYTGGDLATYRRLQLTLYAMAVEEVVLAGRDARPLGLAYWLVSASGVKVALPARGQRTLWFDETTAWRAVREKLEEWVTTLVTRIRGGLFPLQPRSEDCTRTCHFGQICRISQARGVGKGPDFPLPEPATVGKETV